MDANLLKHIKSKFLLKNIFDFIKENTYYFKIFTYSKYFQGILDIKLIDYKEQYFNKTGIKLNDYFSFKSQSKGNSNNHNFNKNLLKNNLESFLKANKINFSTLKTYLIEYYEKHSKEFGGSQSKILLDIYSPFFDALSKSKCFELFIIPIEIETIEKYQLNKDYVEAFNNLNLYKCKNFSVKINFRNEKDIDIIKDFKINFEEIKELDMINVGSDKNINYDDLFKNFFSYKNFGKNLTDLNLKIHDVWGKINTNIFDLINDFQNLKTLELNGINFQKNIKLNLNGIISLSLRNCSNIILSNCNELRVLILSNCNILKNEIKAKLENLERCELLNYKKNQEYNQILDFSSMYNLKYLVCYSCDFINLKNDSTLEIANLYSSPKLTLEKEKILLEKICRLKRLTEITFGIFFINLKEIPDIKIKNSSLKKMHVALREEIESFDVSGFINNFENLSDLKFDINIGNADEDCELNLKIKEDKNCKIDKLCISGCGIKNLNISCGPFSNLIELKLEQVGFLINLEDIFPLFQKNCKIKFDKLNTFCLSQFSEGGCPFEIFKNLYNNLDKVPNLKNIEINCSSDEIEKEIYEKFVIKLLEKKLDSINLEIRRDDADDTYTLEELQELYPSTLTNKNYSIIKYE